MEALIPGLTATIPSDLNMVATAVYIPPCSVEIDHAVANIEERMEDNDGFTSEARVKELICIANSVKDCNWITDGLLKEIQSLFPTSDEIDSADNNKRDLNAFKVKAAKLFSVGRIFASYRQLEQAATLFLNAWAVTRVVAPKSIQCYYSKSKDKRKKIHPDGNKRRRQDTSLKDLYECPFEVRWSFQKGYACSKESPHWKPNVMFNVHITKATYEHTCQLSTTSQRRAIQSNGSAVLNLEGMNDILTIINTKPNIEPLELRPFLQKYLPHHKSMDAKFIGNFRLRALQFICTHGDRPLSFEEATQLSSTHPLAADEVVDMDSPLSRQNLMALLMKVMQEGGSTWDCIRFLDTLKEANPGFDYILKKTTEGRPCALAWMTTEMKKDLVRFGNILFLDSQKRQYNVANWPYIAPVVKDENMKVRVACESICCEESHNLYAWVLSSMSTMEPQFQLSEVRLIFADQLITTALLDVLNISESCILRGDYHHLMNEVWPEKFGKGPFYQHLRPHLDCMLKGTQTEWEQAYQDASDILIGDAEKFSRLEEIYKNPRYYAAWYLRKIEGNLLLAGSVPAEQNHSSTTARLGKGAAWSVVKHVERLIARQQDIMKQRREEDNRLYVFADRYKSDLNGPNKGPDELARKELSQYGFKELYRKAHRRAIKLQFYCCDNGDRKVLPAGGDPHCADIVFTIPEGSRCMCDNRIAFDYQCDHERCVDGKLLLEKYNSRWLQNRIYDQRNPSSASTSTRGPVNLNVVTNAVNNNNSGVPNEDEDMPQGQDSGSENEEGEPQRIRYSQAKEEFEVLLRLASTDFQAMASISSTVCTMTERLRNKQSVNVIFETVVANNNGNQTSASCDPIPGTLNASTNAGNHIRLRSRNEMASNFVRAVVRRVGAHSSDRDFITTGATTTRACGICRMGGHKRGNCPTLAVYEKPALAFYNLPIRMELAKQLSDPAAFHNYVRADNDYRPVSQTLPVGMKGVVIHFRLVDPNMKAEPCLECTCLMAKAEKHARYSRSLFSLSIIARFMVKGQSTIVVSELVAPTRLYSQQMSQMSQQQMSQSNVPLSQPHPLQIDEEDSDGYVGTENVCDDENEEPRDGEVYHRGDTEVANL